MGAESFLTLQIADFAEGVDDRVAALLQAGTGITITYNDGSGTLTIASTVSPTWGSIGGTLSSQTDLQAALNAKMGGSTGSTDNRILRADGTGGATVQNSAVTIDDSGNISGLGTVGSGAITVVVAALGAGQFETALSVSLSDSSDSFSIRNNTSTSNRFVPDFVGEITGSHASRALGFVGVIPTAQDTGSTPVVAFDAWRGSYASGSALVTRPSFVFQSYGTALVTIRSNGNVSTIGSISASGTVTVGTFTVATLPSAAANVGAFAQVTDSSVTTNGSAVSGGGSNRVVVFSNGSTWDVVVA